MRVQALLPEGLVRLMAYRSRFSALGLSPNLAFSRQWRTALESSLVELLPRDVLFSLECVVDVGANLGNWSVGIARLTSARQIIAYEPNPAVFQLLEQKARAFPQIRCVNSAVGATIGAITLNVHEMHQLSSVLEINDDALAAHGASQAASTKCEVPVTTLDHDLKDYERISLLKVDVQGFEPEVFAGARSVLQRTQVLLTEVTYAPYYHDDLQFSALYDVITSLARFELWGISAPSVSPAGRPLWADAIFVQELES